MPLRFITSHISISVEFADLAERRLRTCAGKGIIYSLVFLDDLPISIIFLSDPETLAEITMGFCRPVCSVIALSAESIVRTVN
jgi:hypothetical protein